MKAFHDFLSRMDERVLALVKEKKGALWAEAMPDAKMDSVYVPSVKEPSDPRYDQTFAAMTPLEGNPSPESDSPRDLKTMKISVFNTAKKPVSPTECKAGCMASAIVEASYIWCAPGMVGHLDRQVCSRGAQEAREGVSVHGPGGVRQRRIGSVFDRGRRRQEQEAQV